MRKRSFRKWIVEMLYEAWAFFLEVIHRDFPKEWNLGKNSCRVAVLIPGSTARWPEMYRIAKRLSLEGFSMRAVPFLERNLSPLPQSAEALAQFLRDEKLKDVVLICHSRGALIGKYCMDYHDEGNRIRKMVAISAPFHGSNRANTRIANIFPIFRDMQPFSPVLKKLLVKNENNKRIISIYGRWDNRVVPVESSRLSGAKNIQVPVAGHARILFHPGTIESVIKELKSG